MNPVNNFRQLLKKIKAALEKQSASEFKSISPHQIVLVLAGSSSQYEMFLLENKLSRNNYHYLYHPRQLLGYGWHNAYLLKVGHWYKSNLLQDDEGFTLGWND